VRIAEGLSSREIAEKLVIARSTAERHVANVLNKLGMRSRGQVAVWAFERGSNAWKTQSTLPTRCVATTKWSDLRRGRALSRPRDVRGSILQPKHSLPDAGPGLWLLRPRAPIRERCWAHLNGRVDAWTGQQCPPVSAAGLCLGSSFAVSTGMTLAMQPSIVGSLTQATTLSPSDADYGAGSDTHGQWVKLTVVDSLVRPQQCLTHSATITTTELQIRSKEARGLIVDLCSELWVDTS
jgi:hypothetical protein